MVATYCFCFHKRPMSTSSENQCCYFGLGLFFVILDLDGVGIPLDFGPIPVAVWAVDDGEIDLLSGLGM